MSLMPLLSLAVTVWEVVSEQLSFQEKVISQGDTFPPMSIQTDKPLLVKTQRWVLVFIEPEEHSACVSASVMK